MRFCTILLFAGVLTGSCSTAKNGDENWVDHSFHRLSYRVPPSWNSIRDSETIRYRREDTQMNDVTIKRFKPGETLPDSNLTFDPEREIWTYAEEQYQVLKRDPGTVRAELKEQTRFPPLGKKSVLMKVRTIHTNGVSRQHWIIGAIIDQHYYQIKINAERFGHLPAIQEAYAKFKSSLSIKPRKKEEE